MAQDNLEPLRDLLRDPDTFATTLLIVAIDTLGADEDISGWSPETIFLEFKDELHVELPQGNLDKIMAAITIRTTDRFWKNLPAFIHCCNVLAGDEFDPGIFNPATVKEMAWGITEGLLLFPPDEDAPFSPEICAYIGFMLNYEGYFISPDILQFGTRPQLDVSDRFDTPDQYAQYALAQQDRAEQVNELVRDSTYELLEQLGKLKLRQGDVSDLLKALTADK